MKEALIIIDVQNDFSRVGHVNFTDLWKLRRRSKN